MPVFAQRQLKSAPKHRLVLPARSERAETTVLDPFTRRLSAVGNQALMRRLRTRTIQPKFRVNEPNDRFEREADRVSEQVMSMPEPRVHTVRTGKASAIPPNSLQRKSKCEDNLPAAPPMECNETHSPPPPGESIDFLFNIGDPSYTRHGPERVKLIGLLDRWHKTGKTDIFRIDAYASCDGSSFNNWLLSCERAKTIQQELLNPFYKAIDPIDPSNVRLYAHGETAAFSSDAALNRRATVTYIDNPPLPAAGAIFSESQEQMYAGYDDSETPNYQVVPVGETRIAEVTLIPTGSLPPEYVSSDSSVASVKSTDN